MECPEISELAAFAEGGDASDEVRSHVLACDACQEALQSLKEEVLSLQIPLSELWFRDHISCPLTEVLLRYQGGTLEDDARAYVRFHLEELGCPYCQSRLEEGNLSQTEEGRLSMRRSRERVGEATSSLLDHVRREG
jgi:uncharacterized protein YbaR (Trm112 family)